MSCTVLAPFIKGNHIHGTSILHNICCALIQCVINFIPVEVMMLSCLSLLFYTYCFEGKFICISNEPCRLSAQWIIPSPEVAQGTLPSRLCLVWRISVIASLVVGVLWVIASCPKWLPAFGLHLTEALLTAIEFCSGLMLDTYSYGGVVWPNTTSCTSSCSTSWKTLYLMRTWVRITLAKNTIECAQPVSR